VIFFFEVLSWAWEHTAIIPGLGRLRQEGHKFSQKDLDSKKLKEKIFQSSGNSGSGGLTL
jgi:hypothetical protein